MDDLDLGATIKGFSPGQKVFNRYKLERILGRGGMGVVWLARDEELEREVALKFLPEIVALDPEAMSDLKRETRRNLDLTHPHIVRIYDFVSDGRTAAISMEYVNGATLSTLKVQKNGRVFTVAELAPWIEQLCTALDYAHTKAKIVHRDLKPANLMITSGGELKITDFGIARGISDSVSRVSAQLGASSGTPVYMSPQQMMGEKPAVTDDIYALGATLYELLTGKPPFYSGSVITQVQSKVPPSIAERQAELGVTPETPVSTEWESAIAACLAKDPAARPQSIAALAQRLRGGVVPPPVVTPPPAAPAAPVPQSPAPATTDDAKTSGIGGLRRWVLAPLLAAFFPALACGAFMLGWRALATTHWPFLLAEGSAMLVISWMILTVALLVLLGVVRLLKPAWRWIVVALTALAGAAGAGGVLLLLALNRTGRYYEVNPGWGLFTAEIVTAVLAGAGVGFVAGYILQRTAFGLPAVTPVRTAASVVLGLLLGAVIFGYHLPSRFNATMVGEMQRQYRIWEEKENVRRAAEEARLEAERVAQRALREQQAAGLVREAHRMVFDRSPDDTILARYRDLMIRNTGWDAARLRQEMRASPEGRRGGRLLVPEEFPSIMEAVRAAVPGNAVHVSPGTYAERIYIDKAISLIGAGRDRVIIEHPADRNALHVSKANGVVVRGFTFRHTTTEDTERRFVLVSIDASTVDFEENAVLRGNGMGITVKEGSTVNIRRNLIRDHRWTALSLQGNSGGTITDNIIENSQLGIEVREVAARTEISRNQLSGHQWQGMWLAEGDNLTLIDNRVTGNGTAERNYGGIAIGKGRPTLRGNVARDNIGTGIWWQQQAQPVIGPGNISDGTAVPVTP